MGKDKKALGIKTTRYFTKSCSKCGFEYPNWFTNCPKCGTAWDELEAKAFTPSTKSQKKIIKIVVKIRINYSTNIYDKNLFKFITNTIS